MKIIQHEPILKKMILNDDFKKDSKKIEGKGLDLNLDIFKMEDLSKAITLKNIIKVLNNGFSISQAFIFSKTSTKSILSKEIKLFTNAFENLCRSLKGADVNLNKFEDLKDLGKKSEIILNEEKPTINQFSFPEKKEKKEIEKTKVEFGKIKYKALDMLNEESENEEETEIKELERIHLKKTETIVEVKEEEINKLKAISDIDVTKAIVKRMKKKCNNESTIKLPENFPEFDVNRENILKKSINRKEGDDYVNQPLYSLINDLSKNIYIKLFNQIDKKFKFFHTIIATAMF